jgi:hypothetical protein
MISMYHRVDPKASSRDPRMVQKRLLYICYNTLVRMSVANACELAGIPFWVASTRTADVAKGSGRTAIITSFSCRDRSKATLRKKRAEAEGANGLHKLGELVDMMKRAQDETVKFNPIIISDITTAFELLKDRGNEFIGKLHSIMTHVSTSDLKPTHDVI